MISLRARYVKNLLKSRIKSKEYLPESLEADRRAYDRSVAKLCSKNKGFQTTRENVEGVSLIKVRASESTTRTIIFIHGGGFVLGSAEAYQGYMAMLGKLAGAEVIAIDYGLSPENPYPVALDQIEVVWRELLSEGLDPSKTAFVGDSAGGNLALVSTIRFEKSKIAQPACLALFSSPLDASYGGDSYADNEESDVLLTNHKLHYFLDSYVQGHDKNDPLVSAVRADLSGLPPTMIGIASEELLLSDALTLAKNAERDGVECELVVGAGMWHNWPLFYRHVPEARQFNHQLAQFIISKTE